MADYGVTTSSQTRIQVAAGENTYAYLTVDLSAGAITAGQVFAYDSSAHNFVPFTSGCSAEFYAVANETVTITEDGPVECIVGGKVYLESLDATAQADDDIEVALLKSGMLAVPNIIE